MSCSMFHSSSGIYGATQNRDVYLHKIYEYDHDFSSLVVKSTVRDDDLCAAPGSWSQLLSKTLVLALYTS